MKRDLILERVRTLILAEARPNSAGANEARLRIEKPDGSFDLFTAQLLESQGATSLTCSARNFANDMFAVKLVPRTHYDSFSIESEFEKVRRLGERFARISFYGTPILIGESEEIALPEMYALVMEWVAGVSLRRFLAEQAHVLYVKDFLALSEQLNECLALLESQELVHNDLHDENILVVSRLEGARLERVWELRIIDSGTIKTRARLDALLDRWKAELSIIESLQTETEEIARQREMLLRRINWFDREDQEWIVRHLVSAFNKLLRQQHEFSIPERRFMSDLPQLMSRMLDPDRSMRLAQPGRMHEEIDRLWRRNSSSTGELMIGPFDLISAELIRSPEQINRLFSKRTPWFDKCASTDPTYIYGPRGCGKSTILRKIALESILALENASEAFDSSAYIGVYLSCSAELRSRFWLFPDNEYENIAGDAVEFFNLLLAEALVKSLFLLRDENAKRVLGRSVGLTPMCEHQLAVLVMQHFDLPDKEYRLSGVGWLEHVLKGLRMKRSTLWNSILNRGTRRLANSSVIFDLCKDAEDVFPILRQKHIAFLLDDYSNQRIPVKLQKILNQTISFSKQGNPIFKVSSEYMGVDLTGVQQGREVIEVNFGKEYVDLTDSDRTEFLEDVINIRFQTSKGNDPNLTTRKLLGVQSVSAGTPMARAIRHASRHGKKTPFHYYGVDTISEVCSGDLAMAIDIVREIHRRYESAVVRKTPVPNRIQNEVLKEFSDHEHVHLRYLNHGKEISHVIDRLCWLAHKCAVEKNSIKDGKEEPMIKTSIDIAITAHRLADNEVRETLDEMIRRGCLFSLDTSRTRIAGEGTERYQVRRILLVKYVAPLSRRDPIKLDRKETLHLLIQDPDEFVKVELEKKR